MAAAAMALSSGVALSAAHPSDTGDGRGMRLHVGTTGIMCATLPCPARALFVPGEDGRAVRADMLFVDMDGTTPPPPMIGDPADIATITEAWDQRQCLALIGRTIPSVDDRPVLRVDRILGPCVAE